MDYINVCPKADEKPAESTAWNQTKTSNEETKKKQKTDILRRKGPVTKCVESVLMPEESLRWERFVKEVAYAPAVKERGSYGW